MQATARGTVVGVKRKIWLFFLSGIAAFLTTGCMSQPAQQPEDKPIVQFLKENKDDIKAIAQKTKRELQVGNKVINLVQKAAEDNSISYPQIGKKTVQIVKPSSVQRTCNYCQLWRILFFIATAAIAFKFLLGSVYGKNQKAISQAIDQAVKSRLDKIERTEGSTVGRP